MPLKSEYEVDPETGFRIDSDTGEYTRHNDSLKRHLCYGDSETGERQQDLHAIPRHVFKVPRAALKQKKDHLSTSMCEIPRSTHPSAWVHNMNLTLFILPMLVILPAWFAVMYVFAEGIFHFWAHKNNYTSYKSPLDPMFEHGCAVCRFDKSMEKIGKLQDERLIQVTTLTATRLQLCKKNWYRNVNERCCCCFTHNTWHLVLLVLIWLSV